MEVEKKPAKRVIKKALLIKSFFICVILASILAFVVYMSSDASKVRSIRIINNSFVDDDYIRELCGITHDSPYLFLFTSFKENKAKQDPLIQDIHIEITDHHGVLIKVEENGVVGYTVEGSNEDTKLRLWLYDGQSVMYQNKRLKNIAMLPYLELTDEETLKKVAVELGKVSADVLSRVSLIHGLAFTYDSDMLECVMDDGYYAYISISDLGHLNYYLQIVESDRSQNARCIWFIQDYNKATIVDCSEIKSLIETNPSGTEE